jgi:hypothetical protein
MAELTSILLWTIGFLWAFWGMYVLVMGIYRAHLSHRLKGLVLVLSLPFVAIGYLMDVLAQYTIASLVFLDLPRRGEHLVTSRLIRYLKRDCGWRYYLAKWLCDHLLDVFDPSGEHC